MGFDLNSLINQVKDKGPDQTKASAGGGDYTPPAAGFVRLRLVGYYELGQHAGEFKGTPKTNTKVRMVFELSGPKHPAREFDGKKEPLRVSMTENLSQSEKSWYYKMFSAMNWEGTAKHMVQLIGKDFVGEIEHVEKGEGANKRVYANIKRGSIRKPFVADIESGDEKRVPVDPPLTELKAFVWDFATPEMWDSIFIPGEYEEKKDDKGNVTKAAQSKNIIQLEIMSALNFKGCPIYDYAIGKYNKEDKAALDSAIAEAGAGVQQDSAANDDADDALAGVA